MVIAEITTVQDAIATVRKRRRSLYRNLRRWDMIVSGSEIFHALIKRVNEDKHFSKGSKTVAQNTDKLVIFRATVLSCLVTAS